MTLCLFHLFLYAIFFKKMAAIKSEFGILIYHILIFLFVFFMSVVMQTHIDYDIEEAVSSICLVSIYSMTFLQAWSLAEGSYSFSILESIKISEESNASFEIQRLEEIGRTKRSDRISSLEKLGLIQISSNAYHLTKRGRLASGFIKKIRYLNNIGD